jgi:hypothetical protein
LGPGLVPRDAGVMPYKLVGGIGWDQDRRQPTIFNAPSVPGQPVIAQDTVQVPSNQLYLLAYWFGRYYKLLD